MPFRIVATTEEDRALLEEVKTVAWRRRQQIAVVVRQAFLALVEEDARRAGKQVSNAG
jgi:hypothetical protein